MVCNFSGVAVTIFGLSVYWYSLAYICGILAALKLSGIVAERTTAGISQSQLDEFVAFAVVGVILGGRLGHVFLYDWEFYQQRPMEIVKIWRGGMSFYGGFLGVLVMAGWFCRKRHINFLAFTDLWSVGTPIGLFLGRIANFINGELLGKESDIVWNVVFQDGVHRHPSQIYEAILEGVLLFLVMLTAFEKKYHLHIGRLSGIFCCGYGIARFLSEFFRKPDSPFSYLLLYRSGLNLNQYASVALLLLGVILIHGSQKNEIR
ncbi:MAG: prolipoprotein diacylglyceryl transferase [Holosporaceae bacterium]|nr:prolipoprotein diacylglyceryl transferase [Holosporaceae bacterium]